MVSAFPRTAARAVCVKAVDRRVRHVTLKVRGKRCRSKEAHLTCDTSVQGSSERAGCSSLDSTAACLFHLDVLGAFSLLLSAVSCPRREPSQRPLVHVKRTNFLFACEAEAKPAGQELYDECDARLAAAGGEMMNAFPLIRKVLRRSRAGDS